MAAIMAPVPRFFFCVVEPVMVSVAALGIIRDPAKHSMGLLSHVPQHDVADTEKLATMELGNMLLLLAWLIAIIMWTSRDPRTIRLTVAAMALADIPHWGAAIWVMGWERFVDFRSWGPEQTTQMVGPLITFAIKVAYLMGWLGKDKISTGSKKED